MSTNQLLNYLRRHRKRIGFTQKEIAFLIGCNQISKISRYEKFKQIPHLTTVLAYGIIFQATPDELFGGLFDKVEKETRERAETLLRKAHQKSANLRVQIKIDHLKRLTRRKRNLKKQSIQKLSI